MKKSILILGVSAVMLLAACSKSDATKTEEAGNAAEITETSVVYQVDPAASTIQWKGEKITETVHTGLISLTEGDLHVDNGSLASGHFVLNMKTIQETNNPDTEKAANLSGHLMGKDFFDADSFPTSTFEIVSVNGNNIKGNLTIKGVTKMIEIPATVEITENNVKATSKFTINRNDWGVKWGSKAQPIAFLKDNFIKEDVEFEITLVANRA
ncbi:MAG: YceI family protein [Bacteroidetes bacterium]|nr:YceI family protein [Bacteroidota bacterium]